MKKLIFITILITNLGLVSGHSFAAENPSEGQTSFEQQEQSQYTQGPDSSQNRETLKQRIEAVEEKILGHDLHEKFEALGIDNFVEKNLVLLVSILIVLIGLVVWFFHSRKRQLAKIL